MRRRWTHLAEQALEEIAAYIGQDSQAAAARVVLELIDQAEALLPGNPAIGRPGRVLGTRELVVGQPPYILAYRVRDKDAESLRVRHASRARPEKLRKISSVEPDAQVPASLRCVASGAARSVCPLPGARLP